MEAWRVITKTLRRLWCASNPDSPPPQTSLAVPSHPARVNTRPAALPARLIMHSGGNKKQSPVVGPPPVTISNADPETSRAPPTKQSEPPGPSGTPPEAPSTPPAADKLAHDADTPDHLPNSTTIYRSRPPTSPQHSWQDFKKTAKGALWSILKIAKEASSPLPALEGVLGGVVASVEILNVSTR